MGWSSGAQVMGVIIEAVQANVPDVKAREAIYRPIIDALEDQDWDTQDECEGEDPAYDAVIRAMHPSWYEDGDPAA
jgi:hypothetical protein